MLALALTLHPHTKPYTLNPKHNVIVHGVHVGWLGGEESVRNKGPEFVRNVA